MRILILVPLPYGPPWDEGVKNMARRLTDHLEGCGDTVTVCAPPRNDYRSWASKARFVRHIKLLCRENRFDCGLLFSSISPILGMKAALLRWIGAPPMLLYLLAHTRVTTGHSLLLGDAAFLVGSPYLQTFIPGASVAPTFGRQDLTPVARAVREVPSNPFQILFLGTYQPGRGLESLLEAVAIASRRVSLRLTLAINEHKAIEVDNLKDLVEELGIGDIVDLRGQIDVSRAYKAADVTVIPRQTNAHIAFPIRILESLAFHTPLIVTTACEMDRLIQGCGLAVPPGDPPALAGALETMATDHSLYAKMVRRCPALLEHYSAEKSLSRIHDALQSISR